MSTIEGLNIRRAQRKDCVAIANLIRELAIYEKLEEQCKMTAEVLEQDGFDANPPYFHCLVAELPTSSVSDALNTKNDKTIIGYALYFYTYSTFEGKVIHLEDFYVTPKFRQGGIGSKILQEVAKIAVEGGFVRLNFECLEWNEPSIKFYKKHNAINITERDGFHAFRFVKEVLPKLAGYE